MRRDRRRDEDSVKKCVSIRDESRSRRYNYRDAFSREGRRDVSRHRANFFEPINQRQPDSRVEVPSGSRRQEISGESLTNLFSRDSPRPDNECGLLNGNLQLPAKT